MTRPKVCWINVDFDHYVNGVNFLTMAILPTSVTLGSTFCDRKCLPLLPRPAKSSAENIQVLTQASSYVHKTVQKQGIFSPLLTTAAQARPNPASQPRQVPKWLVFSIDLDYSCSLYVKSGLPAQFWPFFGPFWPYFTPIWPGPPKWPQKRPFLKNWKNRPILASNFHIFGPILTILLVL